MDNNKDRENTVEIVTTTTQRMRKERSLSDE